MDISPLDCYLLFSYIASQPYSRVMDSRGWQFRVLDIHIFINGVLEDIQHIKDELYVRSEILVC